MKTKETYPIRPGSPTPCKQALRKRNFVTVVVDFIPIPLSFFTVCDLYSFDMIHCYCNFLDVNFPLQVTLVAAEYLQDYENLNSQPAQELISKFVTEVMNLLLCCSSLKESSKDLMSQCL